MSECARKNKQIDTSQKLEEKTERLANLHQVSLTSKVIAHSYYRIGVYQWKKTDLEKKIILDKNIRKGLEKLGGCEEPEKTIRVMKDYWNLYTCYGLKEPMLQPNEKIKNADISKYK